MKRRLIQEGILTHCYQRTVNGSIMFYSVADHLVYFTSYCIHAAKNGVRVLGLCQMPDHIHDSLIIRDIEQLAAFKRDHNAYFATAQNEILGVRGTLFEHSYGSAVKVGAKKARANLIYVGNNPVERQLAQNAEDYRWNYVAFANNKNPFSEKLVLRNSSWAMRTAVREVRAQRKKCLPMTYQLLFRLFKPLNNNEKQQLTDYIVCLYNIIDYEMALEFFDGSFEHFITALHSTTGSEYDLNEVFVGRSDACYNLFSSLILKEYGLTDIHQLFKEDKERMYLFLKSKTGAPGKQIKKYLRMREL